jgi:hypothetical protein
MRPVSVSISEMPMNGSSAGSISVGSMSRLVGDAARLPPRRPIGQQPGEHRLLAERKDRIGNVVHCRPTTLQEINEH